MKSETKLDNPREFKSYVTEYLEDCEFGKRLRKATLKSYKEVFENFTRQMPEIQTLDDLDPQGISEFFKRVSLRMREQKKEVKTSTIYTYYQKIKAFVRWLEHKNYLQDDSFVQRMTKPHSPRYEDDKALSDEQVSKLLSAITLENIHDSFRYKRDILIISIFLYTGIRKGELLGLRIGDVNLSDKTLYINQATSKSKKGRTIPLNYSLVLLLKSYLKAVDLNGYKTPYLITSTHSDRKLTEHGLKHWVEKYKRLSGVKFHLHQFRHTFACNLAKLNTDIVGIMNILGHSSTRMTERYLRSLKSEDARSQLDKLQY